MPLYNKVTEVRRAIRSIERQSLTDWELIVVDDGSTDGSGEVARGVADPRIRLLRQPNRGVASARNAGIAAASAAVVAFLDADDEWDADMAATLLMLRMRYPAARVYGTGYRVNGGGGTRLMRLRGVPPEFSDGLLSAYFDLASRSDPPLWTSATAVDRATLEAIGGFPVGITAGEDLLTWARLASLYPIAYTRSAHATFWEPGSASARPGRRPQEPDEVGAELGRLKADGVHRYRAHWRRMRGTWYLDLGDGSAARREFAGAVRMNPTALILWALLALSLLPGRAPSRVYAYLKEWQAARDRPA